MDRGATMSQHVVVYWNTNFMYFHNFHVINFNLFRKERKYFDDEKTRFMVIYDYVSPVKIIMLQSIIIF